MSNIFPFLSLTHSSVKRIGFEDMKCFMENKRNNTYIINTLPSNEQNCLITNTMCCLEEEKTINDMLENGDLNNVSFIIYGKNNNDETAEKKCKQLTSLGFRKVYFYTGGLFEWMLLQDIYGEDEFPTTSVVLDILKYRPHKTVFL